MLKRIGRLSRRTHISLGRRPFFRLAAVLLPVSVLLGAHILGYYNPAVTDRFHILRLLPEACVVSYAFIMAYLSHLVATDKDCGFLSRLAATPARLPELVLGYAFPALLLCITETLLCGGITAAVLGIGGGGLAFVSILELVLWELPVMTIFVFGGILIGLVTGRWLAPLISGVLVALSLGLSLSYLLTKGTLLSPFPDPVSLGILAGGHVTSTPLDEGAVSLYLTSSAIWAGGVLILAAVTLPIVLWRKSLLRPQSQRRSAR